MSHYTKLEPKIMKSNEIEFVGALKTVFETQFVEHHPETPAALRDYTGQDSTKSKGDMKAPPCHVIVRQQGFGHGGTNDAGFLRQAKGDGYDAFVDEAGWTKDINGQVMMAYNEAVVRKQAAAQG